MQKIKVAVDIRDLKIAKTGVKTYLEELVREFKTLDNQAVSFVFLDSFIAPYTGKNKFFKLLEHIQFFIWKQISLPLLAYFKGCNLIFCADFFVPYFAIKARTIPVLHDAFFFEYPSHYNSKWLWLFKNIGITAAKKSPFIVTPTHYTATRINFFTNIELEKIAVVYEGPKSMPFPSKSDQEILGSLFGEKYFLHVGVIEKRKNLLNLLSAFKEVQVVYPDFKLALVGQFSPKSDMDDRAQILNYIKEEGLSNQVILPGYVPDNEIIAWYRNAFLYVFPSYNEGFGIPVLEAFEHKIPVIIANNSCLPEVAGDAALSFNPNEVNEIARCMVEVIEQPELAKELIKRGTERVKLFNWKSTASQLVRIFQTAVSDK
ncbi:glycosyltransferase family 4 protein [Pedobacter flavus]|uniref:Glycosyltransferase family 1 protein n=1 Tax=Pedobacter flavus TaxID=3113906 RepID=A0ABU7H0D0_9SPHI|nr:glycosyltransferase family 1 protein [Pedobacter sp. VNH31]MEE1884739.1 glycosyltransferase family 1 protein [Pedobacter sp. VNH31]